ncbi:hypothetical protein ACJMK2_031970 [Sinanodonta woodiana]|uniref:Mab-21-like HhH/H2TH-like domain-containing protein n=1 Tax=Sinanodonta woodiana TaxID=1069815 RepID=A0ABD3X3X3_SINWO
MKTVVLWQVELHHTRDWDRYHLLDRLIEALAFLKSWVENQNLPAYFVTENNLFDGKINVFHAAISQVPGLRQSFDIYWSGREMGDLIHQSCRGHLSADVTMRHTRCVISPIYSPNMSRRGLLIKMMKATFPYLTMAIMKKTDMSNIIK